MQETITTVIKTCDLCGEKVEEFAAATESDDLLSMSVERWYVGKRDLDICKECNYKLKRLINDNFKCKI